MGEYVESLAPIAPLLGLQIVLMVFWLVEASGRRRAERMATRYFEKWRDEVEAGHRYYTALAAKEERDGK